MSLYIFRTGQLQYNENAAFAALLLGSPYLQMMHSAELKGLKKDNYDGLLQDMFEIKNTYLKDSPYIFLPSGCTTILFMLNTRSLRCYLCGPMTTARKIYIPAGGTLFCVRLKVGRMDWLGKQFSSLQTNRVVPLQQYFLNADHLINQLNYMEEFQKRCEIMYEVFEQFGAKNYSVDPIIQTCVNTIHKSCGTQRVSNLATEVSRSERFLSRSFRAAAGVSVKTYCEIVKFQNSFCTILEEHPRTLTNVVKSYGYYDLPHMNRAYRKFLNYTASDVRYLDFEEINVPDISCDNLATSSS